MKEYVKPKDGKRKLYLSLDMQNFISYTLDQNTTCDMIYESNKGLIEKELQKINNNSNIDLTNFDFFLVDLKEIKKSGGYFISKIKLNRNILIYNFLQNPKTILCFMQKTPHNPDQGFKRFEDKHQINNEKLLEMKTKYLNDKQVENFFVNKTIFLYDYKAKIYNKLKGNLSEKQFTIHGKTDTIIYIQDILSFTPCDLKHPLIDILTVKSGYKPPFYIVMRSEENQWIIGFKNEEKLKQWKNGFDFVLINLNFFMNDINFNIEINNLKSSIVQKESKAINDPIKINNLVNNKYKKVILYKYTKDKKILKLVEDILAYKKLILSEDYDKGTKKYKEICECIKEENKNNKSSINKIISNERISEYLNIYNAINNLPKGENKDDLKNLLKVDLFDNIFEEINKTYINPLLNKINEEISSFDTNNESTVKKHMENIISSQCLFNYRMELDSFLEL